MAPVRPRRANAHLRSVIGSWSSASRPTTLVPLVATPRFPSSRCTWLLCRRSPPHLRDYAPRTKRHSSCPSPEPCELGRPCQGLDFSSKSERPLPWYSMSVLLSRIPQATVVSSATLPIDEAFEASPGTTGLDSDMPFRRWFCISWSTSNSGLGALGPSITDPFCLKASGHVTAELRRIVDRIMRIALITSFCQYTNTSSYVSRNSACFDETW